MNLQTECEKCGAILNTKIKKAGHHIVSVQCVFCGDITNYEINKEEGIEMKIKVSNLQKIIAKNYKKIANQKEELKRLQDKLNIANGIVAKQIEEIKRLNDGVDAKSLRLKTTIIDYQYLFAFKDKTIEEQNIIKKYLESKLFNKGE